MEQNEMMEIDNSNEIQTRVVQQVERGKFRSLTLINWNGFFARTFDLDKLVTTLSGGNGAGKSTTMAGFVTALIPDLTLLHFRNTTEAGATTGSRDKGLHGKLRPGVCYAMLDTLNSRNQRVLIGVRLQQVAGRDKKVDIKPFSLQGLLLDQQPTELLTELMENKQARVLALNELKERAESLDIQFKQYNSIADYHSVMFELGIIPKRLRSASDRSKFYKLIEASLYGGISSAITRSLRDYLLPENLGVKKAFQDMESALRENRMTLEAIKVTQSDRDLFKHLITNATDYVAADYMRHANTRQSNIELALKNRRELYSANKKQEVAQQQIIELSAESAKLSELIKRIEVDYQGASDHLNLVSNAVRQQEKINRYQDDIDELQERLEEQQMIVEEANEQLDTLQERYEDKDEELEAVRSQLADYQQALDAQQTQALQYQQAVQALEKAQQQSGLSNLSLKNIEQYHQEFTEQVEELTEQVLDLEQRISVDDAVRARFEQAYTLLISIVGQVERSEAWNEAQTVLADYPEQRIQAQHAVNLRSKLSELKQRHYEQEKAQTLLDEFNQYSDAQINDAETLEEYADEQHGLLEEFDGELSDLREQRSALQQKRDQLQAQVQVNRAQAPAWLTARSALERISEQSGRHFEDSQDVMDYMQTQLENERTVRIERDRVAHSKAKIEEQMSRLSQPDGSEDLRLNHLAEKLDGVLLSELYDDVTIEDAPFFSALYGPARHAIVVRDLSKVEEQLAQLEDCPDDIYFIQGDPAAFDDNIFDANELERGVVVQVSERELRYSTFPSVPLFGRAAREKRLDELEVEHKALSEEFANLAFDVQKCQRLHQQLSQFVGLHLALAFKANPEDEMRVQQSALNETERELSSLNNEIQQVSFRLQETKEQIKRLDQLLPKLSLLADDSLIDRIEECQEQLEDAEIGAAFIQRHGAQIKQLEPIVTSLKSDPQQFEQQQQDYQQLMSRQKQAQQVAYALSNVLQRRAHFEYEQSVGTETSNLNEQLRQRADRLQQQRQELRMDVQQQQSKCSEYNQLNTQLRSAFETKNQMLKELQDEMTLLGVQVDELSYARALERRETLNQDLGQNRQRWSYVEKQLTVIESESSALARNISKAKRDYTESRQLVVTTKVSWCVVQRLSRDNSVERRLNRRELAYLSAEELRSMSDKALGALRTAVSDNEYLRDSLRHSENVSKPENKVKFFISVYQHLRERIRQDILKTDDPIEAIEQMEVELARLTEELTNREKKLAISSQSVANIMRKTIQREQNRIRLLNQGLQNISFGQVKSVRLVVNIRDTHAILLNALSGDNQEYADLFTNSEMTFSEAIATLYKRVNPHIELGQRTAQTIGEELLDYRNYLELEVEVYRGSDGWLRAESGALSTGEAIGTGMSILLMVVQSWEDESRRIRSADILPCRLLFLDEAARLDGKSISTLFELCERLDMQLLIAAPENISPEKGTTYKLVRKLHNNQEYVHVVGLRGFGSHIVTNETEVH